VTGQKGLKRQKKPKRQKMMERREKTIQFKRVSGLVLFESYVLKAK
jgi:hypothetical protein